MSPTNRSSSPTADPSDWSDLIVSLSQAFGPLISLFGDQLTKQFLSLSVGWADNILLATGPVGIITILVCAIRIGGHRPFKTIIGRAREARVSAEQEFLSSTSDEVCEFWNGREIVRGPATVKDKTLKYLFIIKDTGRILDAAKACQSGTLAIPKSLHDTLRINTRSAADYRGLGVYAWAELVNKFALEPPNLTLNLEGVILSPLEPWSFAVMGIILQVGSLTFAAYATYYWRWLRKGVPVSEYAYRCFLVGTIVITIGLIGCGRVVEGSTTEFNFHQPPKANNTQNSEHTTTSRRIVCLQIACTVGSQRYPSCAILKKSNNMTTRTSRLNNKDYKLWSVTFSIVTVVGFIVQYVGLYALHWSVTPVVVGLNLLMTIVRAWVRRGLANSPTCIYIPEGNELVWTALRALRNDWENALSPQDCEWAIPTGFIKPRLPDGRSICDPTFPNAEVTDTEDADTGNKDPSFFVLLNDARAYMNQLDNFEDTDFVLGFIPPTSKSLVPNSPEVRAVTDLILAAPNIPLGKYEQVTDRLIAAIQGILKVLRKSPIHWKTEEHPWRSRDWQIDVQQNLRGKTSWIIPLSEDPATLKSHLVAGLSLWVYSLHCGNTSLNRLLSTPRMGAVDFMELSNLTAPRLLRFRRIIGKRSQPYSAQDLEKWIGRRTKVINRYDSKETTDPHYFSTIVPHNWPVFGLYFSASFQHTKNHNDRTCSYRFANPRPEDKDIGDIVLDEYLDYPLETECALEILSLLMLSICMSIEKLEGKDEKSKTERLRILLTALAEEVSKAGLTTDSNDALLYIVPAFAKFDLLRSPGGQSPLVDV